jgi:hypothetical protein
VGKTVYIKCVAKNLEGVVQKIDDVPAYEYTLKGYTRKATHVDGLELEEDGEGLGDSDTTKESEPKLIWLDTNRFGGMASLTFNEWLENRVFLEGDIIGYNLYIYNSSLVLKATRTLADVQEFLYTTALQTADFGSPPSEMYIDVEPFNPQGSVPDRVRKHIIKV